MSNRRGTAEAPIVTVLLAVPPTWRGSSRRLAGSIDSILSQTLPAIELIVIDQDAEAVSDVLGRYDDPRLKRLHAGSAGSAWEEGFGESAGRYIALLEPGDVALPIRLAVQSAHLDSHPALGLLACATRRLHGAIPLPAELPGSSAAVLAWKLMLGLPPPAGALMFPARVARDLPGGLGGGEDGGLDLCLRLSQACGVAGIDHMLTLVAAAPYDRPHQRVAEVLAAHYEPVFGDDAAEAAALVARTLAAGLTPAGAPERERLGHVQARLTENALVHASAADAADIRRQAAAMASDLRRAAPQRPAVTTQVAAIRPRSAQAGRLFSNLYEPCPVDPSDPPTMFVVVDTEAEFDWSKPFTRELTSVSAMDDVERGQAVFDRFGLRPIYVVDYPVASQPRGFAKLRAIMERDGCEIGAHLHPWTTPPFEEALSARNSYPGNLDPALEERKLATLMMVIQENFGVSPVFYKAGRYGFGPRTPAALERHGIRIDLSVLPGADLRRQGGPDFRQLKPTLYRIAGTSVLSLPMTRSEVGLVPALAHLGSLARAIPGGTHLHIPSVLARLRLADTITLTPEGVTADEQKRLIRAMLKRGCRQFVLHYHSPSLSPGNTPYATDQSGARTLISRLEEVCGFFFNECGGVPGYPRDLLRIQ